MINVCVDVLENDMHDSPYTLFVYHVSSNILILVLMSMQIFVHLSPKNYGRFHTRSPDLCKETQFLIQPRGRTCAMHFVTLLRQNKTSAFCQDARIRLRIEPTVEWAEKIKL